MYSVFIVDDEIIVREGIRSKIDWDNSAFSFAGEASDGELALSMIQDIKPDILITDIKMPFMDGLELARTVKKLQPWIRIIILSGHDEFDYARKAISIGVEDYILKPFTSEDLLASMNRIAVALDAQKKQVIDIERLKAELESQSVLIKEKLLTDIVMGVLPSADAVQQAAELQINLIARYYLVCVTEIRAQNDDTGELIAAKSRLSAFIDEKPEAVGFFISPVKFVCIVKASERDSLEEEVYTIANAAHHEIERNSTCFAVTTIGAIADRTAHISESYKEAERVMELCHSRSGFFSGKSRVVNTADLQADDQNLGNLALLNDDPLVDRLKYAGTGEIDEIIAQFIKLLGDNQEQFSVIASYLLVDVIMAVSKLVEELGGDIKEVMPELLTRSFVDKAVENQDVFIREVHRVLDFVLEYRNSNIQGRYGDVILRAKQYIDEQYANPDICLHSVAEAVNYSPNHFSTVFSQECGMTFIEYLTQVRIEAAQKLLKNSSLKSSDIAYEVGFNDPHYFSFIFKKTTGMTPRDYRGK